MYKEAEPMEYEKNTNENLLRDAEDILMHMPHELGSALKYVMEYTGTNCRILSDESRVGLRTIKAIRSGTTKKPDLITLVRICKALNIHPLVSIRLIELSGQCFSATFSSLSLFDELIFRSFR